MNRRQNPPTRSYTQRDLKMLWGRSGGICAYPECRESLLPVDTIDLIGEIAHIVSIGSDGPRADPTFSQSEINSYDNLILLCPTHHRMIDAPNNLYSAEQLKGWKRDHEHWVAEKLNRGEPWETNISQPYYFNIPRLGILAAQHGFMIEGLIVDPDRNLIDYGCELNALLLGLEQLLLRIEPKAILCSELGNISDDLVGCVLSFEGGFRTKGIPAPDRLGRFRMKGDPAKDPHIYKKLQTARLVMTINPKWVATSTGFSELTSGSFQCAGLALVKRWDSELGDLFASPLILGYPKPAYNLFH